MRKKTLVDYDQFVEIITVCLPHSYQALLGFASYGARMGDHMETSDVVALRMNLSTAKWHGQHQTRGLSCERGHCSSHMEH